MATSDPTSPGSRRPSDVLDAEWALLCRRHRRSPIIADWARHQPALASLACLSDVIPSAGVDRRPYCQALAALAGAGDELAGRALLQLLLPGLVRLADRWRWQLESMDAALWEVLVRAGLHIGRLAQTEVTGSVAGWLLRSVERDLVDDVRRSRRAIGELAREDCSGDAAPFSRSHQAPSAEEAAFAGPLVWSALSDATRSGELSAASARVVLLHATGHSLPQLARRTGSSRAGVYRLRDRAHAQLRDVLDIAS